MTAKGNDIEKRSGKGARDAQTKSRTIRGRTAKRALSSTDLSSSLIYRIRQAQLWVFKDVGRRLASFEIGPSQLFALATIEAHPGINQLTIAQLLSIERAGVGRLVDQLAQRGLVRRSASTVNRRYYLLHLTDAGTVLLDRVRPVLAESENALAKRIGTRSFLELQRSVEKLCVP